MIKALATEPREGFKHRGRRSVYPSVIHIHGNEFPEKWAVVRRASAGMFGHHIIGRVQMQKMLICDSAGNS